MLHVAGGWEDASLKLHPRRWYALTTEGLRNVQVRVGECGVEPPRSQACGLPQVGAEVLAAVSESPQGLPLSSKTPLVSPAP